MSTGERSSEQVTYPGARSPDRHRFVDSSGLRIAVHEWGDEAAPPILLAHGGFDFAGTFSVFAPLLADAGLRVVSWDHRGHGDSEHAALYSWEADLRDAAAVFDSVSPEPVPVIGHSKGGSLMLQLADALPHRVSHLVNIDGLPSRRSFPDVSDHQRTKLLAQELTSWLDHRRVLVDAQRKPGTIEDLAARRARMNPRLDVGVAPLPGDRRRQAGSRRVALEDRPHPALRRLRSVAARVVDDAAARHRGAGPRHARHRDRSHGLGDPARRRAVPPADGGRLVIVEGAGHFLHIEQPREIADLVLEHVA